MPELFLIVILLKLIKYIIHNRERKKEIFTKISGCLSNIKC